MLLSRLASSASNRTMISSKRAEQIFCWPFVALTVLGVDQLGVLEDLDVGRDRRLRQIERLADLVDVQRPGRCAEAAGCARGPARRGRGGPRIAARGSRRGSFAPRPRARRRRFSALRRAVLEPARRLRPFGRASSMILAEPAGGRRRQSGRQENLATFQDAGFSVARICPPSTTTPDSASGETSSGAFLSLIAPSDRRGAVRAPRRPRAGRSRARRC